MKRLAVALALVLAAGLAPAADAPDDQQPRYDEAWSKVEAAHERGHRIPEPVLAALRVRAPEPAR